MMTKDEARAYLLKDGDLGCPGSRYGQWTSECAEVALVLEDILAEHTGEGWTEHTLDYGMGLVVNDSQDVADLIRENRPDEYDHAWDDGAFEVIKVYTCGHNMAGYLSEAAVYVTDDVEVARECLVDEMNNIADGIDPEASNGYEQWEIDWATDLQHAAENLAYENIDDGWGDQVDYRSGSQAWWINVEMMTRAEYNTAVEEMES